MKGVERGTVKWLRVVESPEKRTWTAQGWAGQGEQAPAMNWTSFELKQILGEVPVAEDGSACFEVPAGKFVYFDAPHLEYGEQGGYLCIVVFALCDAFHQSVCFVVRKLFVGK